MIDNPAVTDCIQYSFLQNFTISFKYSNVCFFLLQGIKDETTTLPEYLTQIFTEDVLLKLGMDSRRCKIHSKKLAKLINEGVQVNVIPVSKTLYPFQNSFREVVIKQHFKHICKVF